MRTYRGLIWHPLKALKTANFEVGVKKKIVALHVKITMKFESLNLEFLSGSYEFLKGAATDQVWMMAEDQPLQVRFQTRKRSN